MPVETKVEELSEEEIRQFRISLKEYFEHRINTLKEYIDIKFQSLEKELRTYQDSNDVNLKSALISMDKRLESMNEFRQTITDQANKYFTKAEHEVWKEKIEQDIQSLRDFKLTIDTKASARSVTTGYILSGIAILISFIGMILTILKLNIF
jgi:hypothetical protein